MGKDESDEKDVDGELFTYCNSSNFEVVKKGVKSLDDTYVYLQPTSLNGHEKVYRKRKFFRIVNTNLDRKDNYVIRQLRAISMEGFKTTPNDNDKDLKPITMSYSNTCELEAENGHTIRIDKTKTGDMWRYYCKHPRRDIRMAFWGILVGVGSGILSAIFSLIGLFCSC
jgi:hypothetical protein